MNIIKQILFILEELLLIPIGTTPEILQSASQTYEKSNTNWF